MNWKKIIFFLLGMLLCATPILWLAYTEKLQMLLKIPLSIAVSCMLLTVAGMSCSGVQYFLSLRYMGCRLDKKDIIFFPFMQSLFGLIIPVQGSSLFAVCYLKMRYHFQMTQSVVMILFLYLLNFVFGGVAGIAYSLFCGNINALLFYGSICCLLAPFFVFLLLLVLKRCGNIPFIPEKYCCILRDSMNSMNELLIQFPLLLKLLGIQVIRQCIMALSYVLIGRQFCENVSFLWGYLIIVSQDISLIFRITPGNAGMLEVVAGLISGLTGVPISDGIGCSLFMTILHMLLTPFGGIWGLWLQMHGNVFTVLRDFFPKIRRS